MRSDGILRHFAFALAIAVALYIASFSWIQHRRVFKGPWSVAFMTDGAGQPSLLVSQPKLNISETLTFPGQKGPAPHLHSVERFDEAMATLPFGAIIFQDPTFLPGTLTMGLFGHEVELLPRVLIVDKKEIPWRANQTIEIR